MSTPIVNEQAVRGITEPERTLELLHDLIREAMTLIVANVEDAARDVLSDPEILKEEFHDAAIEQLPDALEVAESLHEDPVVTLYLGSSLALCPSGKYYTPWAAGNLDECPFCKLEWEADGCPVCGGLSSVGAYLDSIFWEVLEGQAGELGYALTSGEGDPLDTFLARTFTKEEAEQILDSLDK